MQLLEAERACNLRESATEEKQTEVSVATKLAAAHTIACSLVISDDSEAEIDSAHSAQNDTRPVRKLQEPAYAVTRDTAALCP